MFYQIVLRPQVKRCAIITYKHGIYELPDKLPNDLILRTHYRRWGDFAHTKKKKKDLGP